MNGRCIVKFVCRLNSLYSTGRFCFIVLQFCCLLQQIWRKNQIFKNHNIIIPLLKTYSQSRSVHTVAPLVYWFWQVYLILSFTDTGLPTQNGTIYYMGFCLRILMAYLMIRQKKRHVYSCRVQEPLLYKQSLNKFRTVVSAVSTFEGNPVY